MTKRILTAVLAGVIAMGSAAAVSAEDTTLAKGIAFKKDTAYHANLYTGYLGGVEPGATAGDILGALENKSGVEIVRENSLAETDAVQSGDKIVLKNADGAETLSLDIIFVGDANSDSKVNVADAIIMLKHIAKQKDIGINEIAADVNGDGSVATKDVITELQKIAKWDVDFAKDPVIPGKGSAGLTRDINTFSTYMNPDAPNAPYSDPENIRKGQELGVKFSVESGSTARSVKTNVPSWGDNKGSIRFSVYKWNTDYETTVASDPIVTKLFENTVDGVELTMNLLDTAGKGIGEGEYLWLIHEGYDERVNPDDETEPVGIGVWKAQCPTEESGMKVFFEGAEVDPTAENAFSFLGYINIGK